MRRQTSVTLFALLTLAVPAFASLGGAPSRPSVPERTEPGATTAPPPPTRRQQAERLYGEAYDEIARAREDVDAGRLKAIEKRWKKALDRAQQATALDTSYHEAWNLIGFANRKLGNYPRSMLAYQRCLRLAPLYAPAREYYGEALLETDDVAGAREQLRWLRKLGDEALVTQLERAIAAKAGPAPDDSSGTD